MVTVYQAIDLRSGEGVIQKVHAFLIVDGRTPGKNGQLILTDQRLIWTPIRFPIPRQEARSIELEEVEGCTLGGRMYVSRPLIVSAQGHEYTIHFGGNPIRVLVSSKTQLEWQQRILSATRR